MYVDWPLAGFIAVCSVAATLTCRLLVHAAGVSFMAIRAGMRRRREPDTSSTHATFELGEGSSL